MYGKERLFGVLRRHGERPAAEIATAVLDDLRAFKGPVEFEDDATLVVVKWVPTGEATG
jgi:serine phosphatase RsbU (regulator of sigma subunit)